MSGCSGGRSVGVVGEHPAVVDAIEAAGGTAHVGDAPEVLSADPESVVAVGESALLGLVPEAPDVAVLPVDAGRQFRSVPEEAVEQAVDALLAGDHDAVEFPLLTAECPTVTTRALADLMLVTAEPARISEFTVRTTAEHVDTFRSDGVVVATPVGSQGYARAAGGPVVDPGTDVVSVVPVAPFATDADDWVLPADGVELVVERDEAPVELLADDRMAGTVDPGDPVRLRTDGSLTVAITGESDAFYGGREKSDEGTA